MYIHVLVYVTTGHGFYASSLIILEKDYWRTETIFPDPNRIYLILFFKHLF